MEPEIKILSAKKLVGIQKSMSLINNKTMELWRSFMPRRKEIKNTVSSLLYSIRIYERSADIEDSQTYHQKWAAVEVKDFENVPEGMETFTLSGGLYAVFLYKGSSADVRIYQYIYSSWLPGSDYELDDRPHFEVMGEKYKNNDPDSEEEIWIPVKHKNNQSKTTVTT